MSWLKILNVFLLQWFFIRLTRCSEILTEETDGKTVEVLGVLMTKNLSIKVEKRWYAIQGFILPLTGWWSKFVFLYKPFFIKISNKLEYPVIENYEK